MLLKNSRGKKSASFTFATITFAITNLWLLLSVFEKIGPLNVRPFDPAGASLFLAPIMALYFGRRWVEDKAPTETGSGNKTDRDHD